MIENMPAGSEPSWIRQDVWMYLGDSLIRIQAIGGTRGHEYADQRRPQVGRRCGAGPADTKEKRSARIHDSRSRDRRQIRNASAACHGQGHSVALARFRCNGFPRHTHSVFANAPLSSMLNGRIRSLRFEKVQVGRR